MLCQLPQRSRNLLILLLEVLVRPQRCPESCPSLVELPNGCSSNRHAILITEKGYEPGIPLDIDGEERLITDVEIRDGRWYAKDHLLTRGQQEKLTRRAYAIIENDRQPRVKPTKSIRDCQKAIGIAGGIRISLRGQERLITEVRTGGAGNSRWFGGGLRFTAKEQELLTDVARTILQEIREVKGQLPLPYSE